MPVAWVASLCAGVCLGHLSCLRSMCAGLRQHLIQPVKNFLVQASSRQRLAMRTCPIGCPEQDVFLWADQRLIKHGRSCAQVIMFRCADEGGAFNHLFAALERIVARNTEEVQRISDTMHQEIAAQRPAPRGVLHDPAKYLPQQRQDQAIAIGKPPGKNAGTRSILASPRSYGPQSEMQVARRCSFAAARGAR